ncbi:hypothetical protein [Actinosynnema sp. NPDC023587]|uniref:hypothetical protein n=1 Tax=Actinosynnema sp. NPDC023587 TaxID=3154695 RepID=UPI0033DA7AD6
MFIDLNSLVLNGRGRITSSRSLGSQDGRWQSENTYEGTGTFAGIEVAETITTAHEEVRPGSVFGIAHARVATADGNEIALWRGFGAAVHKEGISELIWRGFIVMASSTPKFSQYDGAILESLIRVVDDGTVIAQASHWR